MDKPGHFDVVVIGGGPAGSCAAIRLLQSGLKVALLEQEIFPRPQIGESLSPGIRNIFNYLHADELLNSGPYLHSLPSAAIWETHSVTTLDSGQRGLGVMVDRAKLDADLLELALKLGLILYQPAKFNLCSKTDKGWELTFTSQNYSKKLGTTFILDARGRKGISMQQKIITAPPTVALHVNIPAANVPRGTLIEATKKGWLWGSPLPGGQFRMMAFLRPEDIKHQALEDTFKSVIANSVLFKHGLTATYTSKLQACSVLNYCHNRPWQNNMIRLGETAFTLDPLSSTGVEKAMRLSLQAVIAINTILRGGDAQMAKNYYEEKIIESVATHQAWTSRYYASAWPAHDEEPFWKERSQHIPVYNGLKTDFSLKLNQDEKKQHTNPEPEQPATFHLDETLADLWYQKVGVSADLVPVKVPCVVDDHLELKTAFKSPGAAREIAYIDQVEIAPILAMIYPFDTFGEVIFKWSRIIPFDQAKRVALGLWNSRIICIG